MDVFTNKVIARFQQFRSQKLAQVGKGLLSVGINANILTVLSIISGGAAAYFLFDKYWLFVLLAFLHLLFDALDGVVARQSPENSYGRYLDLGTDSFVTILLLVKVGFFLGDYYIFLITGLFALEVLFHFASRLQAPVIFMRSASVGVAVVASFPSFPWTEGLLTLGFLVAGVCTLYSLARQLQWVLARR
jgi:phosphatidylglycerophosphate synthase